MSVRIDCSTRAELIAIISDWRKSTYYRKLAFTRLIKMDSNIQNDLPRIYY